MSHDEQISHFILIERLGYGGMATVYKAEDTVTGNIVALKILHEQYATDTEITQRFNREADIFYRLKHRNIVPIIDHGEADGKFYIAMQYMAGGTLFERFGYQKEATFNFTLGILEQIAAALDFAHEQGVIHRDLKLENILLDDDESPYLTDFGIAFLVDATRLTSNRTVSGTPLFMSPEQALGLEITTSADIYSLSVMAYLMLTGYHPFTGRDPYAVINQHVSTSPPPPSSVNHELPASINKVLLRGLNKEPAKRYATAGEFAKDLRANLTDDPERTQTMIYLNALNPLAPTPVDEYADTVLGTPSPTNRASTTKPRTGNNRLFVMGGVISVVLILGLIVILTMSADNTNDILTDAQTQASLDIEQDMTATALAPVEGATTIVTRRDGALLVASPGSGREELGTLPFETVLILIGRDGPGNFLEIETEGGQIGFVKSDQVRLPENYMLLPINHKPQDDDEDSDDGKTLRDCSIDLSTLSFGFAAGRAGVELHVEPSRESEILVMIPDRERVKILSVDESADFIEVELIDGENTIGFVPSHHLRPENDEDCLPISELPES